jgi:hypothetical protein
MSHIELGRELFGKVLEPGAPVQAGPLTVVPLFGAVRGGEYWLAADAFADGTLSIEEVGGGVVPQLVARNRGDLPVLLLDGEHLQGARQDRVLNASALIAPHHDTVIPVSCVERGRWHYEERADFAQAPYLAFTQLRAMNRARVSEHLRAGLGRAGNQQEVWQAVAARGLAVGARSATGAMRDAFEWRRGSLEGVLEAIGAPVAGQTGVVACIGGRPVALDAFDRPETLAKLWTRLITGYAMDALGRASARVDMKRILRFVRAPATAPTTLHEGIGLGMDVVVSGDGLVGGALVWQAGVIHAAEFRTDTRQGNRIDRGHQIESPRQRARARRHFHEPRED